MFHTIVQIIIKRRISWTSNGGFRCQLSSARFYIFLREGRGIRFSKPNFEMQRWRRIVRINFLLALACRKSNIPETISGDRLRATIVMTGRSLRQIIFPFLLSLFFLPLLSLSLILSFFHPQPSNLKGPRSYRTIPRIVTLFPDVTFDVKSKGEKAICCWWRRGSVDNHRPIKSFEIKRLLYGNPRLETVF